MAEMAASSTTSFIQPFEDAGYNTLAQTMRLLQQEFPDLMGDFTVQRIGSWLEELESGTGRNEDDLRDDIFKFIVTPDRLMEQYGLTAEQAEMVIRGGNEGGVNFGDVLNPDFEWPGITTPPKDTSPAPGAEDAVLGDDGEVLYPGVMPGGELIQVKRDGQDDLFIQAYEYPPGSGNFVAWQYEGADQLEATFGPDWMLAQPRRMVDQGWFNQNVNVSDSIGEILGIDISFGTYMQNVVNDVISESAITDPSIIGQIANDTGIQNLIAQSVVEGWTDEQLQGEIRLSDFWTQTLYPGIENFYASGALNPEEEWARYMAKMEPALRSLGIDDGGDGYRSEIGDYINAGVDPDLAVEMVPVFQRAANSPQYAAALDQWMQSELDTALDFDTWFDVLAGQATPDIQQVVEQAQLQFVANQQSLALDAEQITRVAELSDLSEAQAAQAFEQVSAQLLALGDSGLQRYGLSEDDILASQTGIEATSGRSISEIKQLARKTALELGLADDRKINLYVGYDPTRGTPTRPGLGSLAPTGA